MPSEAGMEEYLSEIRKEACSRCVERPEGGPPCGPLGKWCGVENRLPDLIDAVHDAHGRWMGPYSDSTERHVCEHCPARDGSACPCPMDQLLVLVVQAVEAVERGGRGARTPCGWLRRCRAGRSPPFNVSSGPTTRRPGPGPAATGRRGSARRG